MRTAVCLVFAALVLSGCSARGASPRGADAGGSSLPDWSGAWALSYDDEAMPMTDVIAMIGAALRPEARAQMAEVSSDSADLQHNYCRPVEFGGYSGGFEGSVEFLFTPGRVTVNWEGGLTRRIYTDGRTLPADAPPSNAGTSVGRWQGQTLIVDTTGLRPTAGIFGQGGDGVLAIGHNARIHETMSLRSADVLQMDVEIEAPELLMHTVRIPVRLQRHRDIDLTDYNTCVEGDRSVDAVSGHQRFDLTPPRDLPPPPAG